MSPTRVPSQSDKLDKIAEGVAEVRGLAMSMERQLTEVRGDVGELGERMAKAENANASTARANMNGYREHGKQLSDMGEKLTNAMTHLDDLDAQVKGLTSVAKSVTIDAAPKVAETLLDRLKGEFSNGLKKHSKSGLLLLFIGWLATQFWPFINQVTSHPAWWKGLLTNIGSAFTGAAKIMPNG